MLDLLAIETNGRSIRPARALQFQRCAAVSNVIATWPNFDSLAFAVEEVQVRRDVDGRRSRSMFRQFGARSQAQAEQKQEYTAKLGIHEQPSSSPGGDARSVR